MSAALCPLAAALLVASVLLAARATCADSSAAPIEVEQQSLTMRGFAHVRHGAELIAVRLWPASNLAVRIGGGRASLIDSVLAGPEKSRGAALLASVHVIALEPPGLSLRVELSTLRVRYAAGAGMSEGTVVLTLSSR